MHELGAQFGMTSPALPGAITVTCPSCKKASRYAPDNAWRPFCSQRCRTADLGAWASEQYRVEASPPADEDADPQP